MRSSIQRVLVGRAEAAVVVLAASVRLLHWWSKWNVPLRFNDSLYYAAQAMQPWEGRWFRNIFFDAPSAEHSPLPGLLLAPVSWMDQPLRWQRLVTVVVGTAAVWVIIRLGTAVSNARVGLAAGLIAAIYPNLWINDGLVMSESISMLLVALSLWAAWMSIDSPGRRPAVLLGIALGLGVLSRSEVALIAVLTLAVVMVARRRAERRLWPVLLAAVVALGLVMPWVAFNLVRFERPVVLTTNDGTTLAGANCDNAWYGSGTGGWSFTCVPEPAGEDPSVRSAQLRSDAVHYVRSDLGRLPVVMAARLARTLDVYGLRDMVQADESDERQPWIAWSGIVCFWLLVLLAVIGRRSAFRRGRVLLALPIAAVLVTSVLFYGGHRIRSSAEPSLVVLAAVGAVTLLDRRRASVLSGRGHD